MKIRCLVVDDEYPARILLAQYIGKIPQLELVGLCKNPLEVMHFLEQGPIDLIFLDIQMPELTGTEFLRTLAQRPQVILTTAYPDYALEGYDLNVTDYLLKPFSFERFHQAVQKVLDRNLRTENSGVEPGENRDSITLRADHKLYRVLFSDILYIEGLREYVTFFTVTGKIITLESLKNLETTLPANRFLRVHKSFIVNRDRVKSLAGNELEIEGRQIPIGKSFKEEVLSRLFP